MPAVGRSRGTQKSNRAPRNRKSRGEASSLLARDRTALFSARPDEFQGDIPGRFWWLFPGVLTIVFAFGYLALYPGRQNIQRRAQSQATAGRPPPDPSGPGGRSVIRLGTSWSASLRGNRNGGQLSAAGQRRCRRSYSARPTAGITVNGHQDNNRAQPPTTARA